MLVIRQFPRCKTYCQLGYCHPWRLDPGNPCRDDGIIQTLVYNDERSAWERVTSTCRHFCCAMENLTAKLKPIAKDSEAIILLHGLTRTSRSMNKAAKLLAAYGYQIINVDYPSRSADIGILAQKYIAQAVKQCELRNVEKIHFLTHSMGGILLRHYLANQRIDKLGRVVMLAPPNQGSEVVDKLGGWKLFYYLNGPAGLQLGTGSNSVPNRLGPVGFELGVIAGSKSVNLLLSRLIPGANDGKVSVSRAQVAGMQDFIVMPTSHPLIMRSEAVIDQALHFIQQGCFAR